MTTRHQSISGLAFALALLLGLVGCSSAGASSTTELSSAGTASTASTVFDASQVHEFSVEVDQTDLASMLQTYLSTGNKKWLRARVTIDGTAFEDAGIKLKGNSSLKGITVDAAPQDLPWRIRLDKYTEGINLDGFADFTVRSNSTETSLNEAVALDLLRSSGLASEEAVASAFSVNGSDAQLRLVVQNLNEQWVASNFPEAGSDSVLYKADADGNWDWLGSEGDYSRSFSVEAGPEDYAPLIRLLDLVNNSSAEQIAAELPDLLDIDAFATYLAFEELIENTDDIDGPGNNSYLFWDSSTQKFTVVAWDHNLAFGVAMGGANGGPGPGMPDAPGVDGQPPDGDQGSGAGAKEPQGMPGALPESLPTDLPPDFPSDIQLGGNGMPPTNNGMFGNNPLVAAFTENTEWAALKDQASAELQSSLIDSGVFAASLAQWSDVVESSGLVAETTITSEADSIRSVIL